MNYFPIFDFKVPFYVTQQKAMSLILFKLKNYTCNEDSDYGQCIIDDVVIDCLFYFYEHSWELHVGYFTKKSEMKLLRKVLFELGGVEHFPLNKQKEILNKAKVKAWNSYVNRYGVPLDEIG